MSSRGEATDREGSSRGRGEQRGQAGCHTYATRSQKRDHHENLNTLRTKYPSIKNREFYLEKKSDYRLILSSQSELFSLLSY